MAGHSKWSNIKRKKAKTDAQRGKIFTKLGREISVAVKEGGSDPELNPRLKDAIAKAKAENMPNDNIERSIKRASGELGTVHYDEITYEGYGPNGVAIIVEVLSDNRNRTAGEMRYIFDRGGGSLGASGCVAWMFERKGVLVIEDTNGVDEDELFMCALDAGAEDVIQEDGAFEILTLTSDFTEVRTHLEENKYTFVSADIEMLPKNLVELGNEDAQKVLALIDQLEDNDDVQKVYHNLNLEGLDLE
ncbi:MAG: YebC/PmpR family DNA-binding transcriptional regulator [Clostridiales bacterium]|nr:YebC/PmpR family DNA-binding transcriptional regulator [Clostridiales bacterium]